MAKTSTTFKPGVAPPPRGKSFKTKMLDAIREHSLLKLPKGATPAQAEQAFIMHVAKRAFKADDPSSAMLLKEFLSKSYPGLKATLEKFVFDFPTEGTDVDKASAILSAVSTGALPPDVGQLLVGIIKDGSIIEANTDLKDRLSAIELSLGLTNE
jgi:hypothetical protein